ncbi:MAG: hypothetical protein M3046_14450 [Actinomycetota bacterium]|nr:hypothetical protein [Actinomycetota bacterium]
MPTAWNAKCRREMRSSRNATPFPGAKDDEAELDRVTDDPEAPEADAFEQAQPAPVEDDDLHE